MISKLKGVCNYPDRLVAVFDKLIWRTIGPKSFLFGTAQFSLWASGAVNYDYIVTNSIKSSLSGSRFLSQFGLLQNISKTLMHVIIWWTMYGKEVQWITNSLASVMAVPITSNCINFFYRVWLSIDICICIILTVETLIIINIIITMSSYLFINGGWGEGGLVNQFFFRMEP